MEGATKMLNHLEDEAKLKHLYKASNEAVEEYMAKNVPWDSVGVYLGSLESKTRAYCSSMKLKSNILLVLNGRKIEVSVNVGRLIITLIPIFLPFTTSNLLDSTSWMIKCALAMHSIYPFRK